jgi:dimeric dUTPase (all-alpha-NTP-PPase superfamily)
LNIVKLFMLQSELEAHIEDKHPRALSKSESRQHEKVLSLLVELGELANETRCFKYWSNKPASEREIILEEFSDGVHFLLSLGLEMGVEEITIKSDTKESLTEQFIGLHNCFSVLSISFSLETYSAAWSAYMGLGEMLGFEWHEAEAAYLKKHMINHARQVGGY